jgi:malonate-semialdehyde dehydrogenase (acetylating) / methylmalonate-semialdehyde dehydrogenase
VQAQGRAKNLLVVMPDAALTPTVANVIGSCFGSAGQPYLAGSLVITVSDIHDRFLAAHRAAAAALRVGNGAESGVDMGPLISPQARERVVGYIERGVREGATLVLDGRGTAAGGPAGCFIGPTIFDDVRPDMAIARDEIFGPLVSVMRAEHPDAAIGIIERSPYGNAASIFTRSGAAAREFRYRAPVGNVGGNVGVAAPMAYFPFSGAKDSFFGTLHTQGRDAIDFYCERKVVITRWF